MRAMQDNLKKFVVKELQNFVQGNRQNVLADHDKIPIYDPPLVGFAAARDPLFEKLKEPEVIGKHHRSPAEWLDRAKTVVSYFLPFSRQVREPNRSEGLPAEEWVSARIAGEEFNDAVRRHLVKVLEGLGGKAVAPVLEDAFAVVGFRSNWSERHAAYAAGLGTFGLSRSLITVKGCAGRYGSVVTTLNLEPDPRPYKGLYEGCPWFTDGSCGRCLERCPSGAITRKGKDVRVCSDYLDNVIKPRYRPRYGCGKCQTAVPCEKASPV